MPLLTIFTPAYNRSHTIGRTYESFCRQTSHEFEWLIVDDGSKDETQAHVRSWLDVSGIKEIPEGFEGYSKDAPWLKIIYVYQPNQGMHGAHNTAYANISTELNTCIDSDDYMPDDAVEKIVSFWKSLSTEQRVKSAGIIGLDYTESGGLIGTKFPDYMHETTLQGFYRAGGRGDKKLVYRTEVINKYPEYPLFEGESYVGLAYKYMLIDQDYKLLTLNEPLVVVDYQLDGSSSNMYNQYWRNPRGFAFFRKVEMRTSTSLKRKFIVCIHYVSSSIISGNKRFLNESPCKLLTLLSIPFGLLLYFRIRRAVESDKLMAINTATK